MIECIWNTKSKFIYFRILIYGGILQILLMVFIYSNQNQVEQPIFRERDSTNNYMDVCALPVYDFWHPDVMRIVRENYDDLANCDRSFKPFTKLENGEWKIEGDRNCSARCFKADGDHKLIQGPWMKPGKVPDCEFLEAVCWENGKEVYGYIHTQIIKKPQPIPTKYENPPNVFVFLMDSLNTGQAKRSLPKFLSYLSSKFGAVEFPFVNKVGKNSLPNGIALWFGKLIQHINNEPFGGTKTDPDWNNTEYCHTPLDNLTIFREFEKHGYMTFLVDDWAVPMINYPNCYGFSEDPTHHHMHPFYKIYEQNGTDITKKHLKGALCRKQHHPAFEYFQQFVDTYQDRPKFTWIWINSLGHDTFNGFSNMNYELIEVFDKNSKMMDDSFVFFMGDHGYQIGKVRYVQTPVGSFETSNPYLSISVPKSMRKHNLGMLETLKQNSRKLQTHFDTRATMLDILKFQPKSSFEDRTLLEMAGEKGHSLLRRQPPFPRTCGRLPIPPEYCICQMEKNPIHDESIKMRYGQKLIDHIHKIIDDSNFTSKCERFELAEVNSLLQYKKSNSSSSMTNFEMTVTASGPSVAVFHSQFHENEKTGEFIFGVTDRLDQYGHTGACVNDGFIEKLCFCRGISWFAKWEYRFWKQWKEFDASLEGFLPKLFPA